MDRPALESEIEITPEMIEAATTAYYEHWDDDGFGDPNARGVMMEVIRAALAVARIRE